MSEPDKTGWFELIVPQKEFSLELPDQETAGQLLLLICNDLGIPGNLATQKRNGADMGKVYTPFEKVYTKEEAEQIERWIEEAREAAESQGHKFGGAVVWGMGRPLTWAERLERFLVEWLQPPRRERLSRWIRQRPIYIRAWAARVLEDLAARLRGDDEDDDLDEYDGDY